jgi:two-component system cell cycle sensor histidine kinase/response regulator CckA
MTEPPTEAPPLARRILVVDDEVNNRQLLEVMLTPEGFSVVTAESGEEALALVAIDPPDLILLDVMMPGMDGFEVAERLKTSPTTKRIPILIVTAYDDRRARMRALGVGVEDFLTKPVDRAELCMRVRNLLRLKAYGDYHDKYTKMLELEVGSRTADLVESERLYRSTFDEAPVGIVHVGLDGQWLRVNRRVCEKLGYSGEELQAPGARALVQMADDLEAVATDARADEQLLDGTIDRFVAEERRFRRRDGTFLWARLYVCVHRNAQRVPQHFIAVMEDITERRTLETQLRQANKMDAIGALAAGVAHDFNNLLSVILSYSEMLASGLTDGDPMRTDLEQINEAGIRAVDLTRQLLAFSRQQVLQPRIVDLSEIVGGTGKMLRRILGEDVQLGTTCASGLRKILVDPGQVEQIIMNLAINARDAMPAGGKLTIETSEAMLDEAYAAEHVGVVPGAHVMLAVSDTGSGMDKATLARIFEPFFTTKPLGKGTGLGLSTVFGIVKQSGATIWVYSEEGVGTTFKVFFPLATDDALTHTTLPPSSNSTFRGAETILLVEDEEPVRSLARMILQRYGYTVLDAQSGGDAFLLCEQHGATIHLLLTDVVMPRMSGRQLAERLLVVRPAMKVLYMSGYTDDAVMRHGILDSTVSFVQKPITPDALARKVREVLDSARREVSLLPG